MSSYAPIIGIPCRFDTSGYYPGRPVDAQNVSYSQAIMQSGGIPILIPVAVTGDMLETLFDRMDGVLFSGGGDVDPACYHQPRLVENLSDIQTERDEHELRLARMAIERRKPFLAICRGIQVMNVAAGGTLYQDLATQNPNTIRHDFYYLDDKLPRNYIAHDVHVAEASLLRNIVQTERVPVNSLHHQAIYHVADSLRIAGQAEDGIVEALEVPDHPFALGVQWHPEDLYAEHESARKLFAAFVQASKNGHG